MLELIYRYRIQILVTLISIDVFFTAVFPFSKYNQELQYWLFETGCNILLIMFTAFVLYREKNFILEVEKRDYIANCAPYACIYLNFATNELLVTKGARNMLFLPLKETYKFDDIKHLFSKADVSFIESLIFNRKFRDINKIGTLKIQNFEDSEFRYIRFQIDGLYHRKFAMNGLCIWLADFTEAAQTENNIVELIKKYRLISFENDLILKNLPFPIWRRGPDLEITYANNEAVRINKNKKNTFRYLSGLFFLKKIAEKAIKSSEEASTIKMMELKNESVPFKFTEIPLGKNIGTIGYAFNITEHNACKKDLVNSQQAFSSMLEISNRAHLVLNYKQEILNWNKGLLEVFDMDEEWFKLPRTFSDFIDQIHELHKLPEVQDYKKYKDKLLKITRELKRQHNEIMHLPNNKTISYYFFALDDGTSIISVDDISNSLNYERALNEQMLVQAKMMNYINEPIVIISQDARLKSLNDAFVKRFDINIQILSDNPKIETLLANIIDDEHLVSMIKDALNNVLHNRKESVVVDKARNEIWHLKNLPDSTAFIMLSR